MAHSDHHPSPSEGNHAADREKQTLHRPRALNRRGVAGIVAGVAWFLLFSGGVLIDSEQFRVALGWKKEDPANEITVGRLAQQLVKATRTADGEKSPAPAAADPAAKPEPGDGAAPAPSLPASPNGATAANPMNDKALQLLSKVVSDHDKDKNDRPKEKEHSVVGSFFCAMLFFTPLNVALLALLAGFIGGCASSGADHRLIKEDLARAEERKDESQVRLLRRRLYYLQENPVYSMIRSFVIYLIFISGLYVFASDPFNSASQIQGFTQYMRLSGVVSLLGFIVGYDPTRFFDQWLVLIPSPARTGGTPDSSTQQRQIKVTEEDTAIHEKTISVVGPVKENGHKEVKTLRRRPRK
jgi:hypothetical protein